MNQKQKLMLEKIIKSDETTALQLIRQNVNKNNIDIILQEIIKLRNSNNNQEEESYNKIIEILQEIQSDLLISITLTKEPYKKKISNDPVINLTGESGSGKSYFSKKYQNDDNYIVIDTDEIFKRYDKSTGYNKELGTMFRKKYETQPDIYKDFARIYQDILDYFKNSKKTLVIDSAQFRNLRTEEELNLLKGEVIVIRTSIDTCYERCIERWKEKKENYTEDELEKYMKRKSEMYTWYKSLNEFIKNIENL